MEVQSGADLNGREPERIGGCEVPVGGADLNGREPDRNEGSVANRGLT